MLFSGDLAVFMQPRCCLVAVKSIFDGSKPNQIPPKGRAKVPPGTVEHPEGAESLAALTAGWPPCKKEEKMLFFLFERHILVSCHLFGAKQIQKSPMFRYKEPILRKYCFSKPAPDTTSSFNESWQFPNKNTFNSPGVFQGVRLSRKFPDGSVLQPEVVDEVIKIIAHSHLLDFIHNIPWYHVESTLLMLFVIKLWSPCMAWGWGSVYGLASGS